MKIYIILILILFNFIGCQRHDIRAIGRISENPWGVIDSMSVRAASDTTTTAFERSQMQIYMAKHRIMTTDSLISCKVIEKDPKDFIAYSNRGYSKEWLGDYLGAISDYSKVIGNMPDDYVALSNRGYSKLMLHDFSGAIADYTKAIDLSPNDTIALYNRARGKFFLSDYRGAIEDFDKIIEINEKDGSAHKFRGLSKIYLKEHQSKRSVSGCIDLSRAGELGDSEAYEEIQKHCF